MLRETLKLMFNLKEKLFGSSKIKWLLCSVKPNQPLMSISKVYAEKELEEAATMNKFGNSEFQQKAHNYYNLDVIISVGYRVKSLEGTRKSFT